MESNYWGVILHWPLGPLTAVVGSAVAQGQMLGGGRCFSSATCSLYLFPLLSAFPPLPLCCPCSLSVCLPLLLLQNCSIPDPAWGVKHILALALAQPGSSGCCHISNQFRLGPEPTCAPCPRLEQRESCAGDILRVRSWGDKQQLQLLTSGQ